MGTQSNFSLITREVQKKYITFRKMGESRESAIDKVNRFYASELQDGDDRIAVKIGLALALCQKKELTKEIAEEAVCEIRLMREQKVLCGANLSYCEKVAQKLEDPLQYGSEAIFKKHLPYTPDWEVGDVFCHTLSYPTAEDLGILGWSIILYKIGEFIDEDGKHRQLVCVSVCPPGKEPTCSTDLQALGFIPMMSLGSKHEYLAQIILKSKRDERLFDLRKIGRFLDVPLPGECASENPLVAMPLFGIVRKNDLWPAYEDQICRIYRQCCKNNRGQGDGPPVSQNE